MSASESAKPIQITSPVVVLVEGPDEQRFYCRLAHSEQFNSLQFVPMGGTANLRARLRAVANSPGRDALRAVGVIRDGDLDSDAAFASAADAIAAAGWPRPDKPRILSDGNPRTGVFIVEGNLDRLCQEAARAAEPERSQCVDCYFECVETVTGELADRPKGWTHAYLAGYSKGDVRVGEGAERGIWPLKSDVFDEIRAFLRNLEDCAPS